MTFIALTDAFDSKRVYVRAESIAVIKALDGNRTALTVEGNTGGYGCEVKETPERVAHLIRVAEGS